jgi:trimethylamine--corrinoid protein Co-methyltransferase
MQTLGPGDIDMIHQASMALLSKTGIVFNDAESLEIFKKSGVRVEGSTVYPTEEQVMKTLAWAPESFIVKGLNPDKNVMVGGDSFVLLPGYGPPFITEPGGGQRQGLYNDYTNMVKLVATSKIINMNGFLMVEPSDCGLETAHLDMLLCGLINCDKPLMGSPLSRKAARDCVDLLAVAHGGRNKLMDNPASVSLCNSLSPLKFSEEMAASIVELARGGQAVVVAALIMTGSSGPITIPGVLALQNAEILAGITLAQLARPGCPVVYGSTSSAMDMKSGSLSIGAPELSMFTSFTAQMARHYRLPCRSGGGLSDSMVTDAQAGAESALALLTAINSGVHFILHAAGILGGYISISLEKFILDEEIAAMVSRMVRPTVFSDETVDLPSMEKAGPGGHFLTMPKTFKLCRKEVYQTELMGRGSFEAWKSGGCLSLEQTANLKVNERLESFMAPDLPASLKKDLLKKAEELSGGKKLRFKDSEG